MTWLRQSDTLWRDFEFTKLTDGAQALWHRANSWIADQLSDGLIPESAIKVLNTRKRYVQELEQAGYWVWQPTGGWLARGWQEIIRCKADVMASRDQTKQRVSKHRNAVTPSVTNAAPSPSPSPSSSEAIADTETTTPPENARAKSGGGGSALPDWTEREAPLSAQSPEVIGVCWYRELLGRDGPPLHTCRRDYAWIGSQKPAERLQVARNIRATTWAASNLSKVTTSHVVRYWASYLEGPRNGSGPKEVMKVSPKAQAYERMKECEKAFRQAERYGEPTEKLMASWQAAAKEWKALPEQAVAS